MKGELVGAVVGDGGSLSHQGKEFLNAFRRRRQFRQTSDRCVRNRPVDNRSVNICDDERNRIERLTAVGIGNRQIDGVCCIARCIDRCRQRGRVGMIGYIVIRVAVSAIRINQGEGRSPLCHIHCHFHCRGIGTYGVNILNGQRLRREQFHGKRERAAALVGVFHYHLIIHTDFQPRPACTHTHHRIVHQPIDGIGFFASRDDHTGINRLPEAGSQIPVKADLYGIVDGDDHRIAESARTRVKHTQHPLEGIVTLLVHSDIGDIAVFIVYIHHGIGRIGGNDFPVPDICPVGADSFQREFMRAVSAVGTSRSRIITIGEDDGNL